MSLARYLSKLGALLSSDGKVPAAALAAGAARANFGAGAVLQVKQITSGSVVSTTNTSWTDTGIAFAFDNALQSNSKVLVCLDVMMGQMYASSWAYLGYVTINEGGVNRGDASYGIAGSAANLAGSALTGGMQYDVERMGGSCLFTPSTTSPTVKLFFRCSDSTLGIKLNSNWNDSSSAYRSQLTGFMMEIAG